MSFTSMTALKAANSKVGQYFFTPATMRTFKSKVETPLLYGRFFITSEQPAEFPKRAFTVRRANADATVDTVGEFMQYPNKAAALQALIELDMAGSHA